MYSNRNEYENRQSGFLKEIKKMRLHLFANKNKVKVLNEMLKKIEGETGLCSPEESLHCIAI